MYRRIAAATVIHGSGECQAYINGVASAEIKRQQAEIKRQQARILNERRADALCADALVDQRNRLLTIQRRALRRSLSRRALDRVRDAYAFIVGTAIVWGMALGLIEEAPDE